MDEDNLNKLAGKIARNQCALFAGAGLSINAGGMGWDSLVEETKNRFDYDSPLDDNFEILEDIVDKNGRGEVHQFIGSKFTGIKLEEPVASLAGLPWFTAFTTNFDTALESALRERQRNTTVRKVLNKAQFEISGLPTHLLCTKLMGSVEKRPEQEGSMVITTSEFEEAKNERSEMFDMLSSHAANLSFLFIGYSFRDELFTDIIKQITKSNGPPDETYYALFREPLDEEREYRLNRLGVEPIIGELDEFAEELVPRVNARVPENNQFEAVPFGDEIIQLRVDQIGTFLDSNDPVLYRHFDKDVEARDFFRGDTTSLKPFVNKWHFEREQEPILVDKIQSQDSDVISVSGPPGSGKTYIISAALQKAISDHRALGFRIASHRLNPIPDPEELRQFLSKIEQKCEKIGVDGPNFGVFYADKKLDDSDILDFTNLQRKTNLPLVLIVESTNEMSLSSNYEYDVDLVNFSIDSKIPSHRKSEFKDYLIKTANKHEFRQITEEQANNYLAKNSEFLPVMYRAVDPARRSIQEIVEQEYQEIENEKAKSLVSFCSIASSLNINTPAAVSRKFLSEQLNEPIGWREIVDLPQHSNSFILQSEDADRNPLFSVYHSVVATHICKQMQTDDINAILESLARSTNLKIEIEAEFVGNLLIKEGVKSDHLGALPFSLDGLENALEILKDRQPARPILHHLARLKKRQGDEPEQYIPILEQATVEPPEKYEMEERRQHIEVSLANMLWDANKEELKNQPRDNDTLKKIFNHLQSSRVVDNNPHSYHVQARILHTLAENKPGAEKVDLLNEALDLVDEGLAKERGGPNKEMLHNKKVEILGDIDREDAEKFAQDLRQKHGDGSGYYTLAKLDLFGDENRTQALANLDKAMNADTYPPEAVALRIKICLDDNYENYEKLGQLARELERSDFRKTWERAYRLAVVYFINGDYKHSKEWFTESHRLSPKYLDRKVEYFWMEGGSRKEFTGSVVSLTSSEGFIQSNSLRGYTDRIYFTPSRQNTDVELATGLEVKFELGFSPRGPQAFELDVI
jgi:tetratricopeptide (TPR) repeat protein